MFISTYNHWQNQKIYPDYFFQIKNRPNANPIFITVDLRCLKYIMNHSGICLYCKNYYIISACDFSFCFNRDVWVLYSTNSNYALSMQLGQAVQLAAASKVIVIPFNTKLLQEN